MRKMKTFGIASSKRPETEEKSSSRCYNFDPINLWPIRLVPTLARSTTEAARIRRENQAAAAPGLIFRSAIQAWINVWTQALFRRAARAALIDRARSARSRKRQRRSERCSERRRGATRTRIQRAGAAAALESGARRQASPVARSVEPPVRWRRASIDDGAARQAAGGQPGGIAPPLPSRAPARMRFAALRRWRLAASPSGPHRCSHRTGHSAGRMRRCP